MTNVKKRCCSCPPHRFPRFTGSPVGLTCWKQSLHLFNTIIKSESHWSMRLRKPGSCSFLPPSGPILTPQASLNLSCPQYEMYKHDVSEKKQYKKTVIVSADASASMSSTLPGSCSHTPHCWWTWTWFWKQAVLSFAGFQHSFCFCCGFSCLSRFRGTLLWSCGFHLGQVCLLGMKVGERSDADSAATACMATPLDQLLTWTVGPICYVYIYEIYIYMCVLYLHTRHSLTCQTKHSVFLPLESWHRITSRAAAAATCDKLIQTQNTCFEFPLMPWNI